MRRFTSGSRALAVLIALTHVACSESLTTTPSAPTTTTTVTETFTGTISRNGARTHTFTTSSSGTITAILVSLSPESVTSIGVSLGTWNGQSCFLPPGTARDDTIVGSSIVGTATSTGTFCVRAYDASGSIPESANYHIEVTHP
jgi:hypothetical protein